MTLGDFAYEFSAATPERRMLAFNRVVDWFRKRPEQQEAFFESMADLEGEDFFGTEGLDV